MVPWHAVDVEGTQRAEVVQIGTVGVMPGSVPDLRIFTVADLDELTARVGLPRERRDRIRAVAAVTGFGITSYVADVLTEWCAGPDDPLWRLHVPCRGHDGRGSHRAAAVQGAAQPARFRSQAGPRQASSGR